MSNPTAMLQPTGVATEVSCTHCGLVVPPGLVEPDTPEQFCCNACRTVYHAIRACGLDNYYAIREQTDAPAQRATTEQRSYEEFDDDAFADPHITVGSDGLSRANLYLEGVHCAACVWLVEKLPTIAPASSRPGSTSAGAWSSWSGMPTQSRSARSPAH